MYGRTFVSKGGKRWRGSVVDWREAIESWRGLSAEERLRREWERIPKNVAESMAFAGEPVDIEVLKTQHARRHLPEGLRSGTLGSSGGG